MKPVERELGGDSEEQLRKDIKADVNKGFLIDVGQHNEAYWVMKNYVYGLDSILTSYGLLNDNQKRYLL